MNPQDPLPVEDRAIFYSNRGNYQQALQEYSQAIDLYPEDTHPLFLKNAYLSRAYVQVHLGDRQGALDDLATVIELRPNDASTYFATAGVRLNLGDRQEAIQDLQRCAELRLLQGNQKGYETIQNLIQNLMRSF